MQVLGGAYDTALAYAAIAALLILYGLFRRKTGREAEERRDVPGLNLATALGHPPAHHAPPAGSDLAGGDAGGSPDGSG